MLVVSIILLEPDTGSVRIARFVESACFSINCSPLYRLDAVSGVPSLVRVLYYAPLIDLSTARVVMRAIVLDYTACLP